MTAHDKIEEAEYFLGRMASVEIQYAKFEASAFLCAARSILDHLLEDFREKFGLGDIEHLDKEKFRKEAEKLNNRAALAFIEWFCEENRTLKNDARLGFLLTMRNVNVHRRDLRGVFRLETLGPMTFQAGTTSTIPVVMPPLGKTEQVTATTTDRQGKVIDTKLQARTVMFFEEEPNEDALELCQNFLQSIKNIVTEARTK